MFFNILYSTIFSIIIIYVVHNIFNYFKNTLTSPKVKDLIIKPAYEYNKINDLLNSNPNSNHNSNPNSNHNSNHNSNKTNNEYRNNFDPEEIKSELKDFFNELNNNSKQDSNLDENKNFISYNDTNIDLNF